jgi:putative transposase
VLLWAAARITSLAAACAALCRAPSDQAVRNALLATLPDFQQLQRRLNQALADGLPQALRRRPRALAIDVTLIPYYGKPQAHAHELYHSHSKASTKVFHAYATAYVIHRGCRWTLALRAVHHSDPWEDVVGDLLRQVRRAGVKVRFVLLDRGFYSVGVIRYLQAARCPFLMPAVRRGRKPSDPRGPSGIRAFAAWKRSGWGRHTLWERRGRRRHATVTIAVCCHRRHRRSRRGSAWVYALWGLEQASLTWLRETYRQRFGIETSYRLLNQARIRTSSRSPLLRLLFVGLALVLQNVWVWLHWEVLAHPRRGRRSVDLNQLPLRAMLLWLQQAVEAVLCAKEAVPAERPWPS